VAIKILSFLVLAITAVSFFVIYNCLAKTVVSFLIIGIVALVTTASSILTRDGTFSKITP